MADHKCRRKAGGDLVAWEFVPGTGGSTDTLNKANVFAILPNYTYDFAPYDTEMAQATAKAGTQLTAGDQVYIDSANGIWLAAGKYTLLPARYAVLPGAVLVSETTVKSAGHLAEGVVRDDGSVTVSVTRPPWAPPSTAGPIHVWPWCLNRRPPSVHAAKFASRRSMTTWPRPTVQPSYRVRLGALPVKSTESAFAWAARYNLAGMKDKDGKEVFAGGQFDLAMQDMKVVQKRYRRGQGQERRHGGGPEGYGRRQHLAGWPP